MSALIAPGWATQRSGDGANVQAAAAAEPPVAARRTGDCRAIATRMASSGETIWLALADASRRYQSLFPG
jgi:hypothetical protein